MFLFRQKPVGLLPPGECEKGSDLPSDHAPGKDYMHFTKKVSIFPPFPEGSEQIVLGMGCFWCSENLFEKLKGVLVTAVGYSQGETKNPTYQQICGGRTNHNEVCLVVFDPKVLPLKDILKTFWEHHDPTTSNKQGNDEGTQYRSGIYFSSEEQAAIAQESKAAYEAAIAKSRSNCAVVTEIEPVMNFYYAEEYHQQYDRKPGARPYCGLRPLGVPFPK